MIRGEKLLEVRRSPTEECAPRMSATPPPLPRSSLAVTCFGHALLFAWAAAVLPWRSGTTFAISLTVLALLHSSTGVLALLKRPHWLIWSWRALSIVSLLVFALMGGALAAGAIYVGKLYLKLGPPVATVLVAAFVLTSLLTLPVAVWGARHTWPRKARSLRSVGAGLSALVALLVFTLPLASSAARATPVSGADARIGSDIAELLDQHLQRSPISGDRTVGGVGPVKCKYPLDSGRLTIFVAHTWQRSPKAKCLQASHPADLRAQLKRLLRKRARPGSVVVVDVVRAVKPLSNSVPLVDALDVRPGLDGVCEDGRCLPAWKLTLSDVFSENRPLPAVPEVSYGFSADRVRDLLGSPEETRGRGLEGMVRIETETLTVDDTGVHRLVRTRPTPPALSKFAVESAVEAAQSYIVAAQERDGTFRYSLDPESGKEDRATLNLPRQAGTTYALCELDPGKRVRRTVQRALGAFEPTERRFGDISALQDAGIYGLGKSALPLLAMLRCREQVGPENDRLIGQLTRLMLRLQRENGSFYPELDVKTARGKGDHEILYAAGQAVLSLVLVEQQLGDLKGSQAEPLPSAEALKRAIDSAMGFYGGPYWPRPLRDFFFFEEGWHCLAARHALTSHRNDAYEQLCMDYVASRLRYVTRAAETSEPNFVGGYGLGDLFPPRNTATSGLGEALNASISIKQKRGLPVAEDKAILADLVTFLLRAQWTSAGCYACRVPRLVVGGFSQQLAAPDVRIDYVQHAMSAIGHGGRLLF
ncbi:MAG: hypothetical protein K0R38_3289 [Polyangiaceae bacterium]|nr:hypothetical protein [Polyangiaceae bacterium]